MTQEKVKKPKGPIRWEAIIPFLIFTTLFVLYFHFFFDTHLRKSMEWLGTQGAGAEVNIQNLETSFWKASLRIRGIEVTDAEKPQFNSIGISDIRFSMLWDALLRLKFVINEAAVEGITFGQKRKSPGKVLPPPPPEVEDTKPSVVATEADKLKNTALKEVEKKYDDNVMGDVVSLLGGKGADVQMGDLEGKLISKQMAQKLQDDLKTKQAAWNERIKSLPQAKELQALGDRIGKVKVKDFKNPQELSQSLSEFDAIFKEADAKYKSIQSASSDFNSDLKLTEQGLKDLEAQVRNDVKDLEKHFKIPQIDAKALSMSLFKKYLDPYIGKINHYRGLAKKYLPPNVMKKDKPDEVDISMQPRPRSKGVTYEFGKPNSYPLFWVKKTSISSEAGTAPGAGNISGQITNITTNQSLIGAPTKADFAGDFPTEGIRAIKSHWVYDNLKKSHVVTMNTSVGSYNISEKLLVDSADVKIGFQKASGSLNMDLNLIDFSAIKMNMQNQFSNVQYNIDSNNATVAEVLKTIFAGIPMVNLRASSEGQLPNPNLELTSNLGSELQKGIEKMIQAKIDEARKKIQAFVDQQVMGEKQKVEAQVNQLKSQLESEIKKIKDQADAQKNLAENKSNQAKKDAENQGRKKLEEEGKKAVDDLKKKFGF